MELRQAIAERNLVRRVRGRTAACPTSSSSRWSTSRTSALPPRWPRGGFCRLDHGNGFRSRRFDAPCAFVLSEQGKVRYASRSRHCARRTRGFRPGWRCRRIGLRALRAGGTCDGPEEIAADIWFSDWDRGGALLEDARHLAQWDQTIALIWFEDEEVPAPEQDRHKRQEEEFGLAELDGVLPWPGRKRRR